MGRKLYVLLFALLPLCLIFVGLVIILSLRDYTVPADISERVSLSLDVPSAVNPDSELLIIPDTFPISLRLSIFDRLSDQNIYPLTSETKWTCTSGSIRTALDVVAEWIPPKKGGTAVIMASVKRNYPQPGLSGRFGKTFTIEKDISVTVISPISSDYLEDGVVEGFNMGRYLNPQDEARIRRYGVTSSWFKKYPDRYTVPRYFYCVTHDNKDLKISRHYTLGDYAMDYPWFTLGFPQYIALDYNLFHKLEALQDAMNNDGFAFDKFVFIYGFRPPSFNLGDTAGDGEDNLKAPFSMHQYGRAVDIIIDTDRDLVLDDLNRDGVINIQDARVMLRYINELDKKYCADNDMSLVGGAGVYDHNDFKGRVQSPYLHIDTRGFVRDDGTLIRW